MAKREHPIVQNLRWNVVLSPKRLQGVVGVEFRRNGETTLASARIETVLAAGAIGSPQIMQCSGIGPAGLLRQHGIPVVHAAPGVGENLQDHLQLRTVFKVKDVRTLNEWANSPFGKVQMGLEYLFFRTGPLTMAPSQLGAFARSDAGQASANPAESPPPPQQAISRVGAAKPRAAICAAISSPAEPCPSITHGSA